jgi:hypothetical protein
MCELVRPQKINKYILSWPLTAKHDIGRSQDETTNRQKKAITPDVAENSDSTKHVKMMGYRGATLITMELWLGTYQEASRTMWRMEIQILFCTGILFCQDIFCTFDFAMVSPIIIICRPIFATADFEWWL